MSKVLLLNAFSLNMLPVGAEATKVAFVDVGLEMAIKMIAVLGFKSAVGHADTASLLSGLLGTNVEAVRATVQIPTRGYGVEPWRALVAQYSGPRLEEGATSLPEGASIRWISVYVD
jgi:hypothetical protein